MPEVSSRLFVGNLDVKSPGVTIPFLKEIFGKYGTIVGDSPRIYKHGYAFVQYASSDEVKKAIDAEKGRVIGTKKIELQHARGKQGESGHKGQSEAAMKRKRKHDDFDTQPLKRQKVFENLPPEMHVYIMNEEVRNYANYVCEQLYKCLGLHGKISVIQNLSDLPKHRFCMVLKLGHSKSENVTFRHVEQDDTDHGFHETNIRDALLYVQQSWPGHPLMPITSAPNFLPPPQNFHGAMPMYPPPLPFNPPFPHQPMMYPPPQYFPGFMGTQGPPQNFFPPPQPFMQPPQQPIAPPKQSSDDSNSAPPPARETKSKASVKGLSEILKKLSKKK